MGRRRSIKRQAQGWGCILIYGVILVFLSIAISVWNFLIETGLIWPMAIVAVGTTAFLIWRSIQSQKEKTRIEAQLALEKKRQQQSLKDMDRLSADELSNRVAEILQRGGCKVTVANDKGDRRILAITMPDNSKIIAMVKRTFKDIGVADVRSLYSLVMNEEAQEGYFFSNEGFTRQAKEWTKERPIQLFDEEQLERLAHRAGVEWK